MLFVKSFRYLFVKTSSKFTLLVSCFLDKPNFQDKCDAYVSSSEIEARNTECKEIVEQVRLMNEYFNQYVEEYYEEFGEDDDIDVESLINKKLSKGKNFDF